MDGAASRISKTMPSLTMISVREILSNRLSPTATSTVPSMVPCVNSEFSSNSWASRSLACNSMRVASWRARSNSSCCRIALDCGFTWRSNSNRRNCTSICWTIASTRLIASSRSATYRRLKLSVTIALMTTGRCTVIDAISTPPLSCSRQLDRTGPARLRDLWAEHFNVDPLAAARRRGARERPDRLDHAAATADHLTDILRRDLHLDHGLLRTVHNAHGDRLRALHEGSCHEFDERLHRAAFARDSSHCRSTPVFSSTTRAASDGRTPFRSHAITFSALTVIVDGSVLGL